MTAKNLRCALIALGAHAARVRIGARELTLPGAREDDAFVIDLDSVTHWDGPDTAPIDIAELARITVLIEDAFEAEGLEAVFE